MPFNPIDLKPGTEVLVRATVLHAPAGNGDVRLRLLKETTVPYTMVESLAPPRPFKVGDRVQQGTIVSIFGDEAWVNYGTEAEPNCMTHPLRWLIRLGAAPKPMTVADFERFLR